MAAKDKPKPTKKKAYKKPTADRISDKDLIGVTGGEGDDVFVDQGFNCRIPGVLVANTCRPVGAAAIHKCQAGGAAAKKCNAGGTALGCSPAGGGATGCKVGGVGGIKDI
jgi:hypothetical protein